MKSAISVNNAPAAIGPYSQAIISGETVYVSGQLPINSKTGKMGKDIKEQTEQILKNIEAILADQNMTMDNVVKTTVFMVDLSNFSAMNEVYSTFFKSPYPARSTIQVSCLPMGAQIEIECIAKK